MAASWASTDASSRDTKVGLPDPGLALGAKRYYADTLYAKNGYQYYSNCWIQGPSKVPHAMQVSQSV